MTDAQALPALTAHYRAMRALVPSTEVWVTLHIGAEQTVVAVGREADPATLLTLAIGADLTARHHFHHTPPNPLELENAIVTVEDEVARARAAIPAGARLGSMDAALREIARLSGIHPADRMCLPLESLERTFERLAQVSLGQPVLSGGLPASQHFAATLLILREFMHHLQFAEITLLEPLPV